MKQQWQQWARTNQVLPKPTSGKNKKAGPKQ